MIESKEALIEKFLRLATQYEQQQNPVTGIDLDDAIVALKRHLLSVEHNQVAANALNEMGRLIRSRDMPRYSQVLGELRQVLDGSANAA